MHCVDTMCTFAHAKTVGSSARTLLLYVVQLLITNVDITECLVLLGRDTVSLGKGVWHSAFISKGHAVQQGVNQAS